MPMNRLAIIFLLFLTASMAFTTTPNIVHADSQLLSLVTIIENARGHIKSDIQSVDNIPGEVYRLYDEGNKEANLLIKAVEMEDTVSSKQHFIAAMTAFKKISIIIADLESQKVEKTVPIQGLLIKKYESNVKKLKIIADRLKVDIDFQQIDQLLTLAKSNYAQSEFEQNEQVLSKITSEGKQINKILYEINLQNKIHKAKLFAQKYTERINNLISQATKIGSLQNAQELERTKIHLLNANTTSQISQNIKIVIVIQQKLQGVQEIHEAKLLNIKSTLNSLEQKAKSLSHDVTEYKASGHFLKKAFYLIDGAKKDLQGNPDLALKKIKVIKDILTKIEKMIYISS